MPRNRKSPRKPRNTSKKSKKSKRCKGKRYRCSDDKPDRDCGPIRMSISPKSCEPKPMSGIIDALNRSREKPYDPSRLGSPTIPPFDCSFVCSPSDPFPSSRDASYVPYNPSKFGSPTFDSSRECSSERKRTLPPHLTTIPEHDCRYPKMRKKEVKKPSPLGPEKPCP